MNFRSLLDPDLIARPHAAGGDAQSACVRFARWDGGPLEVAKAQLSGWYYIDDPKAVEATGEWYNGENSLELLRQGGVNWIWVTFNVGFSEKTERGQREILASFVRRCHEERIRVTAYLSMTNIFIDDMRREHPDVDQWLQVDVHRRPVPYAAARYAGESTRFLGCLTCEPWQSILLQRVDHALALGVDGLYYDNVVDECRCERCTNRWREFARQFFNTTWPWPNEQSASGLDVASRRRGALAYSAYRNYSFVQTLGMIRERIDRTRPGCLLSANHNTVLDWLVSPTNDVLAMEQGREPGVVGGRVRSNIGLLRALTGTAAGRPVRIEYGSDRLLSPGREIEQAGVGAPRFVPMRAEHHQLALAECHSHGASLQLCPEGEFLTDLFFRDPTAMDNWKAIGRYNRFFAEHEELYRDVRTATGLLVVLSSGYRRMAGDEYSERRWFLTELSDRGLMFDTACDTDVSKELLARYKAVLLPDVPILDEELLERLRRFSQAGGRIIATGQTGRFDRRLCRHDVGALSGWEDVTWCEDPSAAVQSHESEGSEPGTVDIWKALHARPAFSAQAADRLVDLLRPLASPPVHVDAPTGLRHNLTLDPAGRVIVHLLNYEDEPCPDVGLRGAIDGESAELFSPDEDAPALASHAGNCLTVSNLVRYAVVRLTCAERP